jgi:hypothetical protein
MSPVGVRCALHVGHAVTVVVLVVSGVLLWIEADLPIPLLDASLEVYLVLTWILGFSVPLYVFLARRRIGARTREVFGGW